MFSFQSLVGQSMNGVFLESILDITESSCFLLASSKATRAKFAIKSLRKNMMSSRQRQLIQHELRINRLIRKAVVRSGTLAGSASKRITKLHRWFETDDALYLVFEFVEGGDLFDYLSQRHMQPSEEKLKIFRGVAEGVKFLHSIGIYHRDIKPENILLTLERDPKLVDFGLASSTLECRDFEVGTLAYMAPEVLNAEGQVDKFDASKADIWSLGVLLYTVVTQKKIWWDNTSKDDEEFCNLISDDKVLGDRLREEGFSESIIDVLLGCWRLDPSSRWTIEQLVEKIEALISEDVDLLATATAAFQEPADYCSEDEELMESQQPPSHYRTLSNYSWAKHEPMEYSAPIVFETASPRNSSSKSSNTATTPVLQFTGKEHRSFSFICASKSISLSSNSLYDRLSPVLGRASFRSSWVI